MSHTERERDTLFIASAFARDTDDCYKKGRVLVATVVVIEDGLNVHSKFRLNGISIHAKHVPKGNLPNVVATVSVSGVGPQPPWGQLSSGTVIGRSAGAGTGRAGVV